MWSTLTFAGRTAEVFTPVERVRHVLLFLPDIDGETLRDHPIWTTLLNQYGMACAVLDGGDSWWLDRVHDAFHPDRTPEQYLLDDVLPWIESTFGHCPIALAGLGMGGQGAIRIGVRHPDTFKIVAGINAALDFHDAYGSGSSLDTLFASREQCRLATPILQIQGWRWPSHLWLACEPNSVWLRGNERFASKLTALGVPFTADFTTTACGHSWSYYDTLAPRLLRTLNDAMTLEARRLL